RSVPVITRIGRYILKFRGRIELYIVILLSVTLKHRALFRAIGFVFFWIVNKRCYASIRTGYVFNIAVHLLIVVQLLWRSSKGCSQKSGKKTGKSPLPF